ncbi:hypothetical protein PF005_g4642 [Phytophthora fragariae]|uniref:Uncharacterized protein n=2 Tax=Phytophthora fragariae TaxID=53985 RepID=A0A6A4A8Z5_9STRA|nr:hypothetical protein PF003_g20662 [Phytophthora fragariae]KAE8946039.1 hypothetical protein PF009_g4318 [Phytophthora fragariae]KAE9126733.1 hypothetical protein PF010_g5167 [Phytophthora fragariae]KAE9131655.1 hypothetical protein PF007_g4029 [Phytophthora fragariae]KAE9152392.1 hypothetical protein PF006_g3380 [Phytophthora fragariae]
MAVKCSMPQFVARCLEEIGLEGRCGMPLRALFDAMDPEQDVVYRRYAWRVLRGMENQLSFHVMRPLEANEGGADKQVEWKPLIGAEEKGASTPRRKRKWKTTLLTSPSCESPAAKSKGDDEADRTPKRHKHQPLQPVLPSMRRIAAQKQRRRLSDVDCETRVDKVEGAGRLRRRRQSSGDGQREGDVVVVEDAENDAVVDESVVKGDPEQEQGEGQTQQKEAEVRIKQEVGDAADETRWVLRSPRGFRLGEEVDVGGLSYDEAIMSNHDGVLGVVACDSVRLKYLGVQDASLMDTISPQFDLLEIIGRARVRGENAAALTNSRLFGDSRKLHYLLDMLIGSNYVVKNIVTADQRRFNIVHLRRFASKFHPSMVSPSAAIARQSFPKEVLAEVIVGLMKARGERTCVFADIGRELGYGKRHQEQLRNYFIQQMNAKPGFPLQLFMARCKTGSEYIGRKLWCVRLRNGSSGDNGRRRSSSVTFEELGPDAMAVGRPVVERGIMEQMYVAIQDREDVGATVPELRDVLGVPTFKLPYKLAQGLISNYNISVEQVVLGKSTMYRMFVPGVEKRNGESIEQAATCNSSESTGSNVGVRVTRATDKYSTPKGLDNTDESSGQLQPGTMKEATRGMVRASTIDRRRNYILKRVQMEKVVSLHQLRTGLIEMERVAEASTMDIRSVRRIVDELVEENKMTTMDITLPPKQVLQKAHRKVKCAVLVGYQRSREAIREFIKAYEEEQQRKYQANLVDHDNDDYVVVSNRKKQRHSGSSVNNVKGKGTQEPQDQEIVKYSAESYKVARLGLAKLQKQSRRLGMFFGMMYKCRAFHLMIWERLELLRRQNVIAVYEVAVSQDDCSVNHGSSRDGLQEMPFTLKDVLDLLTVKEYIQLVGVPELLTDHEESAVRLATTKGGSWDALPKSIAEKLRGCEADRFSKIVRVLLDLRLLQVVHDSSSTGLFNVFQSSDDFDSMVSRVAFATLSGGLFKIKRRVHISVKQGSSVLHRLPSEYSYAYAPGFSCKSKSEHFSGRVPLEFDFKEIDEVKDYWKSLRFLSVEGARLGTKSQERNGVSGVSIKLDGALIQSAPLSDHNIYVLKAWVPHSTTSTKSSTARAKAAAGPIQMLKRKQFQSDAPPAKLPSQKKRKLTKTGNGKISPFMAPADTSESGVSKFRKQVGAKKTRRTHTWTFEEDLQLIDLYLEQMSCRWFVEVPLALQRKEERVAFRTTSLSRTLISWKELGKVFKKKPIECMLRVNDLLEAPAIQARVERAKLTITHMKNPGGDFHEEIAIRQQPRLAALLCRALQVILHERSSYYSVLADMLMSSWKESEVKLVWRYLWLAGIITRTSQANEGKDQKQRGFQVHSKVFEMKSLKIPHYLMETFCEAAKYLAFVNENVDEATMVAEENDQYFEHEIEVNMSSGQAAVALSSMISGFSHLVPSYMAPGKNSAENREIQRAMAVKGLAGHLSRQWGGVFPEDFLKEYWSVKSVFGVSDLTTQAQNIKEMEAFSSSARLRQVSGKDARRRRRKHAAEYSLRSWLAITLAEVAGAGVTLNELSSRYAISGLNAGCNTPPRVLIQREMDEIIRQGRVLEVNGYDHCRFILREFADLYTLHPYRISSDSTVDKVHFHFDKGSTVVARPWLHLDGSVNTKMALKLKRKVVNIVMCCPGIQDTAVHKKMRKIISLQDMRSLLEELMADRIIYARVFRDTQPPVASVFKLPTCPPSHEVDIVILSPGELRYVDFSRDRIHYFPAVNCMELLGAEACDADLG